MVKDTTVQISGAEELSALLDGIAKAFLEGQEKLLNSMVRAGESIAINRVGHIDTGETLNSIVGYRDGDRGVVVAGGNAIWLEFGTGVRKNNKKHPKPVETDVPIYAWGTYGQGKGKNPNGWYYPTTDPTHAVRNAKGETFTTNEGMYIAHTYGIPANYFMLNTAQDLINSLGILTRKNIRIPKK